ncbi:hypothetical protein ACFO5R_14205 [Halosolutus amylolyticus]|uniref:HNH endonuclease n=1 Tax=Halosolutus amylolyticus TaxID=2932267 RepID=A0ABD5PRK5_9EURY|nr:hypothetical protein [Halosolutus amylolyticus]
MGINDENRIVETYELRLSADELLELESVIRADWNALSEPCPKCQGTEFDHLRYEGGHYGHHEDGVVQRTDYWDQKGSLYTACKSCDEVLYKHPAYDLLEQWSDHYVK